MLVAVKKGSHIPNIVDFDDNNIERNDYLFQAIPYYGIDYFLRQITITSLFQSTLCF